MIDHTRPMPHNEAREAARMLLAIDSAGLFHAFRRAVDEACQPWQGGHHDGTRYHELRPSDERAAEQRIRHARQIGFRQCYPVAGWLQEFLGVPEHQAQSIAIDLHERTRRDVVLEIIEKFYKMTRNRRAS